MGAQEGDAGRAKNKEEKMSGLDEYLKGVIRDVPDFPKAGIIFKDITPVLENKDAFKKVIDSLCERYSGKKIGAFVGIESRGFIFAAPLAYLLGASCVLVRKKGKLPYKTIEKSYSLEYGTATIEMHIDSVKKGEQVVVIDDLLATGGTASAACELVKQQGGKIHECAFVVELTFLNGRDKLNEKVHSLVKYG